MSKQLRGLTHRSAHHAGRTGRQRECDQGLSRAGGSAERRRQPADSQHGDAGWESLPAAALLVLPQWVSDCCPRDATGKDLVAGGENRYHAILGNDGPAKFVSPSTIVPVLVAYGAKVRLVGPRANENCRWRHSLRHSKD